MYQVPVMQGLTMTATLAFSFSATAVLSLIFCSSLLLLSNRSIVADFLQQLQCGTRSV